MDEIKTNELSVNTTGFGIAAIVAIIFNTLLMWAKETSPTLLATMKSTLGHHWITHGVSVVLVFIVLGLIFSKTNFFATIQGKTLAIIIASAVVLGGLGLVGWFVIVG